MSFQRKNQVIGRTPANRGPINRNPLGRSMVNPLMANRGVPPSKTSINVTQEISIQNPAIKPSIITSDPTVSTGCSDLDKLLLHGGIPIGSSLLIEESGSTDYASILLKYFATQGIVQNRINEKGISNDNCHVIVIGGDPLSWTKELPGIYKGSKREIKKQQVLKNESKLSVQNLINQQDSSNHNHNNNNNLKIAWRYGLNNQNDDKKIQDSSKTYPFFNNTFDITTRLIPAPTSQEISFLSIPNDNSHTNSFILFSLFKQLESLISLQISKNSNKIIRLILPNLLNPLVYSPNLFKPNEILPFLQLLKNLLLKYSKNLIIISSISLDLFLNHNDNDSIPINQLKSSLMILVEKYFSSIFQLIPFEENLLKFLEKSYKNQPNKIQQGFLNILKISNVSDKGSMMIKLNEFAFRNGKKNFEIDEWSIPVENDDNNNINDKKDEKKQTTKNIDF